MSNLKKQLQLTELLKEILSEVGDLANIKPYPYNYKGGGFFGWFHTEQGDKVRMFIEDLGDFRGQFNLPPVFNPNRNSIFQVAYSVEDSHTQHRKTTYKELAAILKTVVEFCKVAFEDIDRVFGDKPIFLIGSQSKHTEDYKPDPQKDALYKTIILKNLPSTYRTAEIDINGKPVIVIQKK